MGKIKLIGLNLFGSLMLIKENISLSQWTTFKIGGRARYWSVVKTFDELKNLVKWADKKKVKILILGGGSNVLISDNGFDGLVIKNEIKKIEILAEEKNELRILVGSGIDLGQLIDFSIKNNLIGLERLIGIPGTVGGAVFSNAGAYGYFLGDFIQKIQAFNLRNKRSKIFSQDELMFSYRQSFFKKNLDWFIGEIEIKLKRGTSSEKSRELIQKILAERRSKIPVGPSAGCVFKNYQIKKEDLLLKKFPEIRNKFGEKGIVSAGYLIENVGLKNKKVGGAIVSSEHADFIVNLGGATAEDVDQLINLIKQRVYDKFGIELKEEIIKYD